MNHNLTYPRRRSPAVSAKVALFVVLAVETFFFGTFLSAYFYLRAGDSSWPITAFSLSKMAVPIANTVLIALSTLPMALSVKRITEGKKRASQFLLSVVLAMGLIFIAGQVFEYIHSGMRPNDQAFGGVFFTLIGFHALHIVAGIIMLVMLTVRTYLGDFTRRRHIAMNIGAWFWYYVVAVWVVLFVSLYLV